MDLSTQSKARAAAQRRARKRAAATPIAQIMSRDVVTVPIDLSVDSLIDLATTRQLSRFPVVDDADRLVGIISTTDLVTRRDDGSTVEVSASPSPPSGRSFAGAHVEDAPRLAADLMTRKVVSLPETTSIEEAAALMASRHLHGLVVTSAAGGVVGMLSPLDIVGWLAGVER